MNNPDENLNDNKNNTEQDADVLNKTIKELEEKIEELEDESIIFQRRLWWMFEEVVDASYIIEKIEKILGHEKLQQIISEYNSNEKAKLIKNQKQMAIKGWQVCLQFLENQILAEDL